MDIVTTIKEILLFFIFIILFSTAGIIFGFLFISMFIQDWLIFIYKRIGGVLWQTKQ